MKLAPFKLFLQFAAPIQHQAQGAQHRGMDLADGLCRLQRMTSAAFHTGNSQNDHDGQFHTRCNDTLSRFNGLGAVHAFVHSVQCNGIPAFHAVIQKLQPRIPQLNQLFFRFSQNIFWRGIGRDALQIGKILP